MSQKTVYLDVCALSRPFDDQGYLRIRLEIDAVNMILSKVKQGKYRLLFSPVHIKEIEAYDNILERLELQTILKKLGPIDAIRFITISKIKRMESVKRHREWQMMLDKDRFFDEVFAKKS